jgi:thiol reductant ABC exporter CydC subunit
VSGDVRGLVRVARLGRPVSGRLLLAVLAGVGAAGASVGLAATSAWLISRAAEQPPVLALLTAVTSVRAFGIARGVLRYAERVTAHDAAFRVLGELRATVYARIARLAPVGLADLRTGDLLSRFVDDVDALADVWLRVLLPYASVGIVAVGAVVLEGWLVPAAGLALALTVLLVAVGAPAAATAVAARSERRTAPARGELADATRELLAGAPELLAAGAAGWAIGRVTAVDDRLAAVERRASAGAGVGSLVAGLAAGLAAWACLVLAIAAFEAGALAGVTIAVVALTPLAVHEIAAPLVPAARRLPALGASAGRVVEVVDRADPVVEPRAPRPLPAGPYGLRASALRLRHRGASRDAVAGLGFELPAGAHAIVTGPSGSGKSTLALACLRFVAPAGGSLALVGAAGEAAELADLAGDDVRRTIGLCEQDPHIFDATVVENIRLARPGADEAAVAGTIGIAQLSDWIETLPHGAATPVGEAGARISGGQRQRIALARALLADVGILVLDEPTEHLDEPTARAFVADLARATAGRTVLVLTHRPDLFDPGGWMRLADLAAPPEGGAAPEAGAASARG